MAAKTPAGDMPRMVPDRDDIRSRNTTVQPDAKAKTPASAPPRTSKPAPAAPANQSWVMVTLLIVAGISIGYLALQQYSLTQLLTSYEERLELADERIVSLERSLTETDESVAMNGTAINAQFKAIKSEADLQMSEIRKLWDVTNKRNKKWIEDNQANLAKQETTVADMSKLVAAVEAGRTQDAALLESLQLDVTAEREKLASVSQTVEVVSQEMGTVNRAVESLVQSNVEEQVLTLTLKQEDLFAEQGALASSLSAQDNQLGDVQSSIKSIDAYRLDTNKRINSLTNQLDTLEARLTALTGSSP